MKQPILRRSFLTGTIILAVAGAQVCHLSTRTQASVFQQVFPVGQAIPDNEANGLAWTGTVTGSGISHIGDVNVSLQISGGYNGDLYVTLAHDTGYAVLLNRVGSRSEDGYGYADSGFSSTFRLDDQAIAGDVHTYRLSLNGDHNVPVGGALAGLWQPDGRAVSPLSATDASPRTATLSAFNNLNADGEWRLYLADLAPVGQATLVNWGLQVTSAIPEPSTPVASALLGATGLALHRWRRKRAN